MVACVESHQDVCASNEVWQPVKSPFTGECVCLCLLTKRRNKMPIVLLDGPSRIFVSTMPNLKTTNVQLSYRKNLSRDGMMNPNAPSTRETRMKTRKEGSASSCPIYTRKDVDEEKVIAVYRLRRTYSTLQNLTINLSFLLPTPSRVSSNLQTLSHCQEQTRSSPTKSAGKTNWTSLEQTEIKSRLELSPNFRTRLLVVSS